MRGGERGCEQLQENLLDLSSSGCKQVQARFLKVRLSLHFLLMSFSAHGVLIGRKLRVLHR